MTFDAVLEATLASPPPLRICFDVDGVLCDDRDITIPYRERKPYPWVASLLSRLKAAGHTLVIQTARYMQMFDGNQQRAHGNGYFELVHWLRDHDIPFDEVYLGKASANIYVDDRGCRVQSNAGTTDWARSFVPVLAATQSKKANANLRV